MELPKDSFIALAAVAWADDDFSVEEKAGLLSAAEKAGVAGTELDEIREVMDRKVTILEVETVRMSRRARVLTYSLATWMARLDGVVTSDERESLKLLGDRLGLPDGIRSRASAAAFEVAELPSGDRPDRYDFALLQLRLQAKLGDIEAE